MVRTSHAAGIVGDINNDGTVNVFDLSILLSDWGKSGTVADLNGDGTVNILDLSTLLSNWGKTGSPTPTPPPSSSPGSYACTHVWPSDNGRCGPYASHPGITGIDGDPWVDQNVWSGNTSYHQTMHANSPSDWYITANANTNFGGVLTYAAIGWNQSGAIDAGHSISSSWSTTIPSDTTKVAGWAAYDLWFNDWNDEVMIQTDITAPSANYNCDVVATPTFNGIPWHLCVFDTERVLAPGIDSFHDQNIPTGSTDILPMLKWLEANGHLPANSVWTAGSYGFEVCDTHNTNQDFRVSGFTWNSQ